MGGVRARNTQMQRLRSMTEQERQMLITLCARMGEEKNAAVLTELLSELNTLLDKVEDHKARRRLKPNNRIF
jgi:hypothetical protein